MIFVILIFVIFLQFAKRKMCDGDLINNHRNKLEKDFKKMETELQRRNESKRPCCSLFFWESFEEDYP